MNSGASLNRPQRPKNCILTFDQIAEKQPKEAKEAKEAKEVRSQSIYNNESLDLWICIYYSFFLLIGVCQKAYLACLAYLSPAVISGNGEVTKNLDLAS